MLNSAPSPRRARLGVSLMFFTNGVLLTALLPRLPEVKAAFGLSNSEFGLLVIAFPVGAVLTAAFAGKAIRWLGAIRIAAFGSAALAAALALAGTSSVVWLFAAAMAIAGALDAIVDAAQNVHGVAVEQWRGRSILNSLHALWSAGAALGGVIGAFCAAAEVSLSLQMIVNGVVWTAVAFLSSALAEVPADVRQQLAPPAPVQPEGGKVATTRRSSDKSTIPWSAWKILIPLSVLAMCGSLVEDIANNWAVLFMRQEADAPTAIAGLAVTVILVGQFLGRILGDPMTDRWGRGPVAQLGGVLIASGAALVVVSPSWVVAFFGFALTGIGCATLLPAAFASAGRISGLREGTGIAVISWLMRLGFLGTSPTIGFVSDHTSLRTALLVPVGAGLLAVLLARLFLPRPSTGPAPLLMTD